MEDFAVFTALNHSGSFGMNFVKFKKHFQDLGHSFSSYGPPSRQITYIYFLLNNLREKYGKNNVGLYRDDGLVLLRNASGPQSERTRKDITREFRKQGLNNSISTNQKICNFLDVTLTLRTEPTIYTESPE